MKYIKIIRPTFLSGEPAAVGDVFEVDQETAALVIGAGRAQECDRPEEAQVEPPKRKVVKVSKKESKKEEKPAETDKDKAQEK